MGKFTTISGKNFILTPNIPSTARFLLAHIFILTPVVKMEHIICPANKITFKCIFKNF